MPDEADLARTCRVFEEALQMTAPAPDLDIVDAGLIDSLGLVTLLFELEREFGVAIPLESLNVEDFRTLAKLTQMVATLKPTPSA